MCHSSDSVDGRTHPDAEEALEPGRERATRPGSRRASRRCGRARCVRVIETVTGAVMPGVMPCGAASRAARCRTRRGAGTVGAMPESAAEVYARVVEAVGAERPPAHAADQRVGRLPVGVGRRRRGPARCSARRAPGARGRGRARAAPSACLRRVRPGPDRLGGRVLGPDPRREAVRAAAGADAVDPRAPGLRRPRRRPRLGVRPDLRPAGAGSCSACRTSAGCT